MTGENGVQAWLSAIRSRPPAYWPRGARLACCLAVLALVLVAGWAGVLRVQQERLGQLVREREQIARSNAHKEAQLEDLAALAAQRDRIRAEVETALAALPGKQDSAALLGAIAQAAQQRQVALVLARPGGVAATPGYGQLPLALTLRGSYPALAGLMVDLANLGLVLNDLVLGSEQAGTLELQAQARAVCREGGPAPRQLDPPLIPAPGLLRDPFAQAAPLPAAQTPAPPIDERLPWFARHALAGMAMVGTITVRGERQALVRAGTGVYRVRTGQRLGPHGGTVASIGTRAMTVRERGVTITLAMQGGRDEKSGSGDGSAGGVAGGGMRMGGRQRH